MYVYIVTCVHLHALCGDDLFIQIKKDQTVGNRLMHVYVFSLIVKGHETDAK